MTLVESGKLTGLDFDWKSENWPLIYNALIQWVRKFKNNVNPVGETKISVWYRCPTSLDKIFICNWK